MADFDSYPGFDGSYPMSDGGEEADSRSFARASVLLWVIAAIEVLLWGLCAAAAGAISLVSPATLGQALPPHQPDLRQVQWQAGVSAVATTLVLVLPGVALAVLAFYVRQGRDGPRKAARLVLAVQMVLIGVTTLLNLIAGLAMGNLAGAVVNLLVMGAMIGLLFWGFRALGSAAASTAFEPDDGGIEPWNSHLSGR